VKRVLTVLSLAIFALGTASATTAVTYSTSATFDSLATETFSDVNGSVTFSFVGLTNANVLAPSGASFGTVNVAVTGAGFTVLNNIVFNLIINQTIPVPFGPLTIAGIISGGTITGTSSSSILSFSPAFGDTADGLRYTLTTPVGIVPPSTNFGNSTLQGFITETNAPEPASMALMGAGLAGLGLLTRRKKVA
jgi:hypothetical protein